MSPRWGSRSCLSTFKRCSSPASLRKRRATWRRTDVLVPFFTTPSVDGIDALMAFDRETVKLHPIFVRDAV